MKLDRTTLKYIAVIAMILDHIGVFLLSAYAPGAAVGSTAPGAAAAGIAAGAGSGIVLGGMTAGGVLSALYVICRFLGRLTAPIMCFFLAEGFAKTSSRRRYVIRLLVFALISQVPYALAHHGGNLFGEAAAAAGGTGNVLLSALTTPDFNMIATLFLSFLVLVVYDEVRDTRAKWLLIILIIAATYYCDWGVFCPLFVLCFRIFRGNSRKQMRSFCVIAAILIVLNAAFLWSQGRPWYAELWQLGMFLFPAVIRLYDGRPDNGRLYDGQPGKESPAASAAEKFFSLFFRKWFFYLIYPVHLAVFWLIHACSA